MFVDLHGIATSGIYDSARPNTNKLIKNETVYKCCLKYIIQIKWKIPQCTFVKMKHCNETLYVTLYYVKVIGILWSCQQLISCIVTTTLIEGGIPVSWKT
jgi:hypothetical protein